jgi:hypothetical protein
MSKKILPYIVALSALSLSGSAAYYSVSGLSKLFAGAGVGIIILATSLEISKLIIASLLYQYWDSINKILKTYLTIACIILMVITSIGVYGFLSSAYQETSNKLSNTDLKIELIQTKINSLNEQKNEYIVEKNNISKSTSELRSGLANNKLSYTDTKGHLVVTSSESDRKSLEKQLNNSLTRQENINNRLDSIDSKILDLQNQVFDTKSKSITTNELGSLKYLEKLTKIPMDEIVNILILTIILVFDPLAISLVIAANFIFAQNKKTNTQPKEDVEQIVQQIREDPEVIKEIEDSRLIRKNDNFNTLF